MGRPAGKESDRGCLGRRPEGEFGNAGRREKREARWNYHARKYLSMLPRCYCLAESEEQLDRGEVVGMGTVDWCGMKEENRVKLF